MGKCLHVFSAWRFFSASVTRPLHWRCSASGSCYPPPRRTRGSLLRCLETKVVASIYSLLELLWQTAVKFLIGWRITKRILKMIAHHRDRDRGHWTRCKVQCSGERSQLHRSNASLSAQLQPGRGKHELPFYCCMKATTTTATHWQRKFISAEHWFLTNRKAADNAVHLKKSHSSFFLMIKS